MNNMAQFKISGQKRREKKKELAELKFSLKNFWYFEDIDRVMGGGVDDNTCQKILDDLEKQISVLEELLSEPATSIVRDNKLNELGI